MATVGVRTRPLVTVLSRVPLFVEALAGTFGVIAELKPVNPADPAAEGLLLAFRPDAVIAERDFAHMVGDDVTCVSVDLEAQQLFVRRDGDWIAVEGDLAPEAIRNAVVAELYGGAPA